MDNERRRRSRRAARPTGLQIKIRHGRWHVVGTVTVGTKRLRVRRSLGLSATRPRHEAEAAARAEEERVVQELLYGKKTTATFAHACKRYIDDRLIGKSKEWRDPELAVVQKLAKALGHAKLAEITTPILQAVITKLFGRTSASNQARACNTLGGILGAAQRHNLIDAKPYIPRPKSAAKLPMVNKWLYPEEIALILDCMPSQIWLPVKIMFLQGRRPSEILYREWEDLDLRRGRKRLDLGITKPGERESIALDSEVVEDLKAHAATVTQRGMPLEGPMFMNAHGEPWHNPESRYGLPISKPFRQGRAKAAKLLEEEAREPGISQERRDWLLGRVEVIQKVTAYWGRHNFVSHHVAGQTAPLAIAEMVGWKSLDMLSRYGHLSDGHLRSALDSVHLTGRSGKKGESP